MAIAADKPLYYGFCLIGGVERKIYATEEEALKGGQDWDLEPIVYYRVKKPVSNIQQLPALNIDELFEKDEEENSQIAFTVSKANINMSEVEKLELSDEQTIAKL